MRRALLALALAATATAARAESPRWGSFEVGFGGYRPDVDSDFTSPGPYRQVFGTKRGWMFRLGLAKALLHAGGPLEVGVQAGYFQQKGKAQLAAGGGDSGDETAFKMVPVSLGVGYRLELLAERWRIPFAPYGRVALERYQWWVTDGAAHTAKDGATNGWSVAGGLALLLDFFDPSLARELDRDSGVNHTYLFFEAKKSKVDDFGASRSWDLSEEKVSYTGGILFAF